LIPSKFKCSVCGYVYDETVKNATPDFPRDAAELLLTKLQKAVFSNVESGEVFVKKEKTVWICRNCGHIVDSEKAPEKCPVCAHPQSYFELRVINY